MGANSQSGLPREFRSPCAMTAVLDTGSRPWECTHSGRPVRLDLDPDRPGLPEWVHAHGLEPVSRTAVMAHGDWNSRGNPDWLFAPISVALA